MGGRDDIAILFSRGLPYVRRKLHCKLQIRAPTARTPLPNLQFAIRNFQFLFSGLESAHPFKCDKYFSGKLEGRPSLLINTCSVSPVATAAPSTRSIS
jgi:hypothetical protein